MFMHTILLQGLQSNQLFSILLWVGIIVVFYFFMIRPQQQKQKDQKSFINSLKKGDVVVTIGGMHGRVVSVEETTVILDVDKGLKMTFDKSAVAREATKLAEAK